MSEIEEGDDYTSYDSVHYDVVSYLHHGQYNSVIIQLHTNILKGLNILDAYDPPPYYTQWTTLAQLIGRNTYIEYFQFSNDGEDEEGFAIHLETFLSDIAKNRSLKLLLLEEHDFSNRTRLGVLHPFVIENDNLAKFSLSSCNFGTHDLQMLAAAFSQRRNPASIKVLDISGDNIVDESVPVIIDICGYCPRLQKLDLGHSRFGIQGVRTLAILLANPECKLRCLRLDGNNAVDDDAAEILANSLVNNNKLETLRLKSYDCNIATRGWEHFLGILRGTSNINATSSSNHTLCSLWDTTFGTPNDLPTDLEYCLHLNKEKDKKNVIRRKIIKFHLNTVNLSSVIGTDQEILPNLLGWIGKDNANENRIIRSRSRTAFYRIIRNFPDLCGFETYDRKVRRQLEAEVASLKAENATIKSEVVTLKTENEELRRKVEQLAMGK